MRRSVLVLATLSLALSGSSAQAQDAPESQPTVTRVEVQTTSFRLWDDGFPQPERFLERNCEEREEIWTCQLEEAARLTLDGHALVIAIEPRGNRWEHDGMHGFQRSAVIAECVDSVCTLQTAFEAQMLEVHDGSAQLNATLVGTDSAGNLCLRTVHAVGPGLLDYEIAEDRGAWFAFTHNEYTIAYEWNEYLERLSSMELRGCAEATLEPLGEFEAGPYADWIVDSIGQP